MAKKPLKVRVVGDLTPYMKAFRSANQSSPWSKPKQDDDKQDDDDA